MAHGMNDEAELPDSNFILKAMQDRLEMLNHKLAELKPMEEEAKRLRAAINAYNNVGQVTTRERTVEDHHNDRSR